MSTDELADSLARSAQLQPAREALAGRTAWVVGGTVRDAHLGRPLDDLDLVVDEDPRGAAMDLARASDGHAFELSEEFGAWRVVAPDRSWQADVTLLRGGSIETDLELRDFGGVYGHNTPLGVSERAGSYPPAGRARSAECA